MVFLQCLYERTAEGDYYIIEKEFQTIKEARAYVRTLEDVHTIFVEVTKDE